MIVLNGLQLPDEMAWVDQFTWTPVSANIKYTLQGKAVVQTGVAAGEKGRPVTLGGDNAWLSKGDLEQLYAWASSTAMDLVLTLHDGSTRIVGFRHWESPVIDAHPVHTDLADPAAEDLYVLTSLKLVVL